MENKLVFAVFDVKAGYYKNPFMLKTKGEALRGFSDVANDKETEIGKHPEDFCLFLLSTFDEVKGTYKNESAPVSLGMAIEFVKPKEEKL